MIIPVDKAKIINEFKLKYVEERYSQEIIKIYERFNKNKDIKEEIIANFKKVCGQAINFQEKDLKGEIQYIYISFLRTSLIENKGIYRINLYDDKWFLDKEECFININLDFIYESLFSHISELQEKKKQYAHIKKVRSTTKNFKNIREMDIESIKFRESDKYHTLAIKILQSMISDFLECDEYKDMKKHEEIMILAGEYRDECTVLYENPKAY